MAVLLILSLVDDQALFNLEIFDRSAVWYLGIGGPIMAGLRGMIPDENAVMDPQKAMEEVVSHTHYLPKSWRGKIHTYKVLNEFNELFQFKFINFALEFSSVILVPLLLIFSLPSSAGMDEMDIS